MILGVGIGWWIIMVLALLIAICWPFAVQIYKDIFGDERKIK